MDRIWRETLARLDAVENRLNLIEEIAQEPLQQLKAKKKESGSQNLTPNLPGSQNTDPAQHV